MPAKNVLEYLAIRPAAGAARRVVSGQTVQSPATAEYTALVTHLVELSGRRVGLLAIPYDKPGGMLQTAEVVTADELSF